MTHATPPILAEAIRLFMIEMGAGSLRPSTLRSKQRTLDFLAREAGGDLPVPLVTRAHYQACLVSLKRGASPEENAWRVAEGKRARTGRGATSLKTDETTLRKFAEFCRVSKWTDPAFAPMYVLAKSSQENPGKDDARKALEMSRLRKRSIPEEEWHELLRLADLHHPRTRIIIAVGLYTGRRVSEIAPMKWGDLDLATGNYDYWNQKRGRPEGFTFDKTLADELDRWRKWLEAQLGPVDPGWYVIPAKVQTGAAWPDSKLRTAARKDSRMWPVTPTRPCGATEIDKDIQCAVRKLGWTNLLGVGEHTLRRGFARYVYRVFGLEVCQRALGHGQPSTTLGYIDENEARERAAKSFRGQRVFASAESAQADKPEPMVQEQPELVELVDLGPNVIKFADLLARRAAREANNQDNVVAGQRGLRPGR